MIESRILTKIDQNRSEIIKNRIRHHQHRASEASGPTRIRFCAKYQKINIMSLKTQKTDSDLDPIHQILAFRAHSFQALKPKK
jgi:hypothetical protein